ncbi:MAG: hypothetical protein C0395_07565 [Gemmatimonas sp.]|nr:hypothetical protein [Gemmatimonas sp.]
MQYNALRVYVLGAVANPGSYTFETVPSLWDALRAAGGPAPDANLTQVRVVAEGTGETTAAVHDISGILTGSGPSTPVTLRAGRHRHGARQRGGGGGAGGGRPGLRRRGRAGHLPHQRADTPAERADARRRAGRRRQPRKGLVGSRRPAGPPHLAAGGPRRLPAARRPRGQPVGPPRGYGPGAAAGAGVLPGHLPHHPGHDLDGGRRVDRPEPPQLIFEGKPAPGNGLRASTHQRIPPQDSSTWADILECRRRFLYDRCILARGSVTSRDRHPNAAGASSVGKRGSFRESRERSVPGRGPARPPPVADLPGRRWAA